MYASVNLKYAEQAKQFSGYEIVRMQVQNNFWGFDLCQIVLEN